MKEIREITLETTIKQIEDIDTSDIDGEKIMMNLDTGSYFMLNEIATHIWDLTEQPVRIEEVVKYLLGEYEIDEITCKEQVLGLVIELYKHQLITIV
ncbi:lasso peptide biosynthesis PqqD family chaperone [Niameybacter massiliensis]|uniref:Lasso peptide biosynthesis PqqD family chaperone n=1 Tax=Holtiella tumoricola TaxID=3018743 RepID=A0AA42J076_9FIRM|nr:lasso peptide biosynthesis PqqD family chaperone [Holtiella tumoricola]MDA3730818.1 lasso peptide biosynthesis PqqD family chaperone [Holtiella tumoricola]